MILTLCMVYQPSRLLLGMKKRGFGAGNLVLEKAKSRTELSSGAGELNEVEKI
ncbi:MAG: hypothetical protein Q8O49_01410 [bacterium]|nr:hypothetical protein [bacterium]